MPDTPVGYVFAVTQLVVKLLNVGLVDTSTQYCEAFADAFQLAVKNVQPIPVPAVAVGVAGAGGNVTATTVLEFPLVPQELAALNL